MKIGLVTDGAADLPLALAATYEIQVVPHLLDVANGRELLLLLLPARHAHRQGADRDERRCNHRSSHVTPPGR